MNALGIITLGIGGFAFIALFLTLVMGKKIHNRGMAAGIVGMSFLMFIVIGGLGGFASVSEPTYTIPGAPAPGDGVVTPAPVTGDIKLISSLKVNTVLKGSNARATAVGHYDIYDAGTNPSDPLATTVDYIGISAGTGTGTNTTLMTNTQYRRAFDGLGTYYSVDYGDGIIPSPSTTSSTVSAVITLENIMTVATYGDLIEEDDTSDATINGNNSPNISAGAEIGCVGSCSDASTLIYDESNGDADFYLLMNIECSGSNKYCKDTVLCFARESTTVGPEWNEFSSITVSHWDGNALWSSARTDITNYFYDGGCVPLGTLTGGQSETIKMFFAVTESATDSNDDFLILIDDNGAISGLDVCRNTCASSQQIDIDFQD